jgi:hypothetical protein
MTADTKIYIVDEIRPKPGKGKAFLEHYMETYAPAAVARGLKLEYTWVNPPVWLTGDQQNTLLIIWSVDDVSAYWEIQTKIRWDRSIAEWWSHADEMVTSRKRLVLGDSHQIAGLTDV